MSSSSRVRNDRLAYTLRQTAPLHPSLKGGPMQRIICAVIVLTTPLLLAVQTDDAARKELKALEGKWKTVAMEAAGMQLPKDAILDFSFVAAADGKATGKTPGGEFQFTMTVDPKKKP